MKLVLLADTLGLGGSERTVQIISNSYKEIDQVISIANEIEYEFDKDVKIITLLQKNYSGYIKILLLPYIFWKLYRVLKTITPTDVVSFHSFSNILNVISSKILNYKAFVSERQYSEVYFGRKNMIMKPFIPFLYNRASGVICNDKDIKLSLQNYYHVKRPILVLNNLFTPLKTKKETTQKTDDVFRFLTVGRLSPEKNTKAGILAFSKIDTDRNIEFLIVGDGYLRNELENYTKSLGLASKVSFIGHSNQVAEYYNTCDAFVFTSLNEGFPNVVLEAMSFGLPIVSYRFKAGIETILGDNEYGVLVDMHDTDALSKIMQKLVEDEKYYGVLSKQALERVKQFSDKEAYIYKFKSFIENVKH